MSDHAGIPVGSLRRGVRASRLPLAFLAPGLAVCVALAACIAPRGGWDVAALLEGEPALREKGAGRLGDLLPHPVLYAGALRLVACRFEGGETVRVRGGGAGWRADWAAAATDALDRGLAGITLALEPERAGGTPRVAGSGIVAAIAEIDVQVSPDPAGAGPSGLGDTLVVCDVGPRADGAGFRGRLLRAEIRMRRGGLDLVGRPREASAEEWVGGLLHELGHALGFAGHVASGDSVLVREAHRLRRFGRTALAGGAIRDATLEALYSIPAGRDLGGVALAPGSRRWVEGLERLRAERIGRGDRWLGARTTVGDEEARLVWLFEQGDALVLRFPRWRRDLAEGAGVEAHPEAATRRAIEGEAESERPASGAAGRGEVQSSIDASIERASAMRRSASSPSPRARSTTASRKSTTASSEPASAASSRCSRARTASRAGCL